jgi:hypothetical protein
LPARETRCGIEAVIQDFEKVGAGFRPNRLNLFRDLREVTATQVSDAVIDAIFQKRAFERITASDNRLEGY